MGILLLLPGVARSPGIPIGLHRHQGVGSSLQLLGVGGSASFSLSLQ